MKCHPYTISDFANRVVVVEWVKFIAVNGIPFALRKNIVAFRVTSCGYCENLGIGNNLLIQEL